MAASSPKTQFALEPYSYREARSLAAELGVAEPLAVAMVRRGYHTAEAAREFIQAEEDHDPFEFDSMARITVRLLAAARGGRKITVHGDYDVDGVCSTAILVRTLREVGATCDWLIPDRASDGYGLTMATIEKLGERGTELLLTADCGIGSGAEVAAAAEAGIETIVTDHHQPPDQLPDCPILHPVVSGYPFAELCATAVAYKLAVGLRREAGAGERRTDAELELVALATVADMVPLVGENRRLVRAGLAEARRGARPGLRALIEVSRSDPATLDAGDLGFRIAPRINAAGRLYRADAGVELMLTEDPERAAEIAAELDSANAERRATERQVLAGAERQLAAQDCGAPAIVLAGEGWHPGVIGIVASRLVERHWRPVILIALDGASDKAVGRGSGRSIPGFDLVEALGACAERLERFGGHAAAAGLEIDASEVGSFREAFGAHAARRLTPEQLVRRERIDAVVGVGREGIGIELAEQLEQLAPFGSGNPEPRLLVPAARLEEIRPLGQSGDHVRFQLRSGAGRAQGVAFGVGSSLSRLDGAEADLTVRLEVDRWNGAVQPRVVLGDLHPLPADAPDAGPSCPTPAPAEEWWDRFAAELEAPLDEWPSRELRAALDAARTGSDREPVDRRRGATVAAIAGLASSGASVLVASADASRRRALVRSADPSRLGADPAAVACSRCAFAEARSALGRGGLALADWSAIARDPALVRRFEHVVLVDPPPFEHLDRLLTSGASTGEDGVASLTPGYMHIAWGEAELDLAARFLAWEWDLRPHVVQLYRALARSGRLAGEPLAVALAGEGRYPRPPELAGRAARVLIEAGLCAWERDGTGGALRVVSSEETDLHRSQAYRAYGHRHEEGKRFLRRQRQPERLPAAA